MPCRPAEHDVRYEDAKLAEEHVVQLVAERRRVRRLLFRWCGAFADDLPASLRSAIGAAQKDRVDAVPADPGLAAGNSGADGYPIGSWGMGLMFRVRREEERLCEERTLLARMAALLDPPDELEARVEEELAAHREHRAADLEALRDHLRDRVARSPDGPDSFSASRDRARLARAEQLTLHEILTDRAQLASLWQPG